jgi:hypothetical protein
MIDESSKDNRTIFRRYGQAPTGHKVVIPANSVCGERYSIVAAMGIEGYIATRVVPGSVDSDEFFDFSVNRRMKHIVHNCGRFRKSNGV